MSGEDYYAFDGMYINYDKIKSEWDLRKEEIERNQHLKQISKHNYFLGVINDRNETKVEQRVRLANRLKSCRNNKEVRNIILHELMMRSIVSIWQEYAKSENLSSKYIYIATSKNGMAEIVNRYLSDFGIPVDYDVFHLEILNLFSKMYSSNETTYERVNRLQEFIHNKLIEIRNETNLNFDNRCKMRNILSIFRFHLMYVDLTKVGFEKIINEYRIYQAMRALSESDIEKNLRYAYMPDIDGNRRVYTENWRRRHFRTLVDYLPEDMNFTRKIVGIDLGLKRDAFLDKCIETAKDFGIYLGSLNYFDYTEKPQDSAFINLVKKF